MHCATILIELQVRGAAYHSLAAFPCETLEAIGALRPLRDVADLLLAETDVAALPFCVQCVQATLAFEHSQRRRYEPQQVIICTNTF